MIIDQQQRDLEGSPIVTLPPVPFTIPEHAAFILQFAEQKMITPYAGDEKPTATDAHSTGGDGSSPDPGTNESLDWENDD